MWGTYESKVSKSFEICKIHLEISRCIICWGHLHFYETQNYEVHNYEVQNFETQNYESSKLRNFIITKLKNYECSKFRNSKLRKFKITKFQKYGIQVQFKT